MPETPPPFGTPPPYESSPAAGHLSFAETLALAWRMITLQGHAFDEARSPRVGLLLSLSIVIIGGALEGLSGGPVGVTGGVFWSVVAVFVLAGILHVLATVVEGHGDYMTLVRSLALVNLVTWIGFIPLMSIVAHLWYVVLLLPIMKSCYRLTTERAALVIVLPALILLAGAVLVALGLVSLAAVF